MKCQYGIKANKIINYYNIKIEYIFKNNNMKFLCIRIILTAI